MNRFPFLVSIMLMTFSSVAVELIRDGQALAEIVIVDKPDPSVKTAAVELQKYLKKMSGAELPIVTTPTGKTPVYVGPSDYTDKLGIKLDDVCDDGFKIVVNDGYVALVGRDQCRPAIPRKNTRLGLSDQLNKEWQASTGHPWVCPSDIRDPRNFSPDLGFHIQDANGTLYAVYEFLETLGMRWFMPVEDIGQVVPERRDISISPMSIKKEPRFSSRFFLLCGVGFNQTEFLWYKSMKQGGVFDQWPAHSSSIVSSQKDRPDLIAYSGGKAFTSSPNVYLPRLASPQLRAELGDYLVHVGDAFPELLYLPIGQPDGWCMLDDRDVAAGWDKKEEGDKGRFSDYTWDFVLDVAKRIRKERPNAKFNTMVYGFNRKPPKLVDIIPADIAITFCQNSSAPGFDDYLSQREEWLKKAPDIDFFIYDYYLAHFPRGSMVPVPAIFTAQMERSFKTLPDRCRGTYTELSWNPTSNRKIIVGFPGINHLMIYLNAKFTWDKNLDVKATLADYYEKFYGPAKSEMQEFFEYSEEVWMRPSPREITAFSGFLKPADVSKYFEILDRAKAKAGDSVYGRRIDFIAEEILPLKKLFKELQRTGPYVRLREMDISPQIDGDLMKPFWTGNFVGEQVYLKDFTTGISPEINGTTVAFRWLPDSSLLVGVTCYEKRMDRLHANTLDSVKDDDAIFNDDNIEVHLETPGGYNAVIVVNPNGSVCDRCTTPDVADVPAAWNVEQVAVRKLSDRWTVEIKVKGLGSMPTKSYPWGINVFRQRLAGGEFEGYAISPTGTGKFREPKKMGNLYGP